MLSVECLSAPSSISLKVGLDSRPVRKTSIKHNQHIRVVNAVCDKLCVAQGVVPLELADTKLSSIVKDG